MREEREGTDKKARKIFRQLGNYIGGHPDRISVLCERFVRTISVSFKLSENYRETNSIKMAFRAKKKPFSNFAVPIESRTSTPGKDWILYVIFF